MDAVVASLVALGLIAAVAAVAVGWRVGRSLPREPARADRCPNCAGVGLDFSTPFGRDPVCGVCEGRGTV